MKYSLYSLFLAICVAACIPSPIKGTYQREATPAPPDYRLEKYWAALPTMQDAADQTPDSLSTQDQQAEAKADVFFVHPTTYFNQENWNADLENVELNQKTDEQPIRHQASIFNNVCKVYAPRYRQMAYEGFFTEDSVSRHKAIHLAYSDVKNAFEYYLKNYNKGRPIVIASHSQGTLHATRLVKEFFDGTERQEQLVAAYLVGYPFKEGTFSSLPIGESPTQTQCVLAWCTFLEGYTPKNKAFYEGAVMVNPVSWKRDAAASNPSLHQGLVMKNYKTIHRECTSAQIHNTILWVSRPSVPFARLVRMKDYHIADYNMFWFNVRENVAQRVEAFLQKQ